MFISTVVIAAGTLIVSMSNTFEMFIIGRVISGAGASGIFIVASIITIQMTSPERRGLFIGLVNTGMTAGVSLGAVIAGALESKIGWVNKPPSLVAGRANCPRNRFLAFNLRCASSQGSASSSLFLQTILRRVTLMFSIPSDKSSDPSTTRELSF